MVRVILLKLCDFRYAFVTSEAFAVRVTSNDIYTFIRPYKKLGRAQGIGILKNQQGEAVLNDGDKANLLNQFFSSVNQNVTDNNIVPDFPSRVSKNTRLESVQFRPETVSQKIKPKLSQGPDGYPPYL